MPSPMLTGDERKGARDGWGHLSSASWPPRLLAAGTPATLPAMPPTLLRERQKLNLQGSHTFLVHPSRRATTRSPGYLS